MIWQSMSLSASLQFASQKHETLSDKSSSGLLLV